MYVLAQRRPEAANPAHDLPIHAMSRWLDTRINDTTYAVSDRVGDLILL